MSSFGRVSNRLEFIDQQMIENPKPCNFYDSDIDELKSKGVFPESTFIRPFDLKSQSDWYSERWVCFPEYPFTIGLKYPFPSFNEFFSVTGICYAQTTPMIWRTLSVIQTIIDSYDLTFDISELSYTFILRNSGSGFFAFQTKPNHKSLVFNVLETDPNWESRSFFVFRDSLPNGDLIPSSWVPKVNLARLAPSCQDTKIRIEKFLEVPEEERNFQYPEATSKSLMPKSAKTGSQKSSAHFTLEDIDDDTLFKENKAETNTKPCSQVLHSIMKKRKLEDITKPSSDFDKSFEFFYQGMEHASKCYLEKLKVIEAMDEIISIKNKAAQDDADEIARLRKKIEGFEITKSVEFESLMTQEKQKMLAKAEKDAAISVLETRILMANEASIPGFNTSSWRSEIWKDRLAILKGQDPRQQ